MDLSKSANNLAPKDKIYVVLVGSAPMAGFDSLLLSLEKFKGILGSDSAKTRFETTLRSVQENLAMVDAFIEKVYAEKNPLLSVTMKGRTLIIEISLTKDIFIKLIDTDNIEKILQHITAVGTMPPKKLPGQTKRDYLSFPVSYKGGRFVKKN